MDVASWIEAGGKSVDGGEIMASIEQRLDELEIRIRQPGFRRITGRANEVNQWVFDYAPKDELIVRRRIAAMKEKNERGAQEFTLAVFNIYDIIMNYLEGRNFIEKTASFEKRGGFERVKKAIRNTLRITDADNKIVAYITSHMPERAVIFLTGIGTCYPILEAQEIFNKVLYNMPPEFSHIPVVLFYPGIYTEQSLMMFSEVEEGAGYYRAFRMVQ